ncbi:hypothetical protein ANN_15854 [Periplaneta americana]|uniref:Ribosomal RNA large subunit methyltransferase K/L-like methyltransferase domain-containing protein n=1 Tax=Periplaneta americana TaxID=6978 RepID=A0ABQ8SJB2_PERAM|nr:hypothetical protein ANN_15854 [Periplaneta americana]
MDDMKEWRKNSYFCTVGNGMETFCLMELSNLKGTSVLEVTQGKIFFLSNCKPHILLSLKSIERLFVMVFHCKQFLCDTPKKAAFFTLKTHLERDIQWELCLQQWFLFQSYANYNNAPLHDDLLPAYSAIMKNHTKDFLESVNRDEQQPFHKKFRLDTTNDHLTFRVSCKSTGIVKRLYKPYILPQFIGYSFASVCGWKVDLRNPKMEIYVHANEEYFTIGLPVVPRPLSERRYLKHIALRSTVCYAMLLCVGSLVAGAVLLDPMCGAGTLITEAAMNFQAITVIGVDIDILQLKKANENVHSAIPTKSVVELIHADVAHLPLKNESVNCIVCDLPFGRKFGTPGEVKNLIPMALLEMNRILILSGRIVFLINEGLKDYLFHSISDLNNTIAFTETRKTSRKNEAVAFHSCDKEEIHPTLNGIASDEARIQWKNKENHTIKLGEIFASICVFEKCVVSGVNSNSVPT